MKLVYVAASLLVLTVASPGFAQTPRAFDVSGGYSFLRDQEIEENFHGWVASVSGYFNEWFGITGEVGGNYKTMQVFGTDIDLSIHSFMAGPRVAARGNGRVEPFMQVLLGGARASAASLGVSESQTEFAVQPGGGVDLWMTPSLGIRVGADYRRIVVEDEGSNEFRFHAGIVVR